MATFGRCERSPPKVVVVTQDAMQGGKAAVPRNTLEHETKQILYPELGKEKLATQPEYWRPFQSALLKSPVGAHRLRRLPDDQELDRRRWFQDQAARAFHEAKDGATKAAASQRGALAENLAQAGRAALSATTPRSTQRSSADGPGLTPRSEKQRTTSTLRTEERPVTADLDTAVALILGQSELSSTSALRLARAYTYWDARSAAEKQSKHARPGGDNRIIPLSGAQAQATCHHCRIYVICAPVRIERQGGKMLHHHVEFLCCLLILFVSFAVLSANTKPKRHSITLRLDWPSPGPTGATARLRAKSRSPADSIVVIIFGTIGAQAARLRRQPGWPTAPLWSPVRLPDIARPGGPPGCQVGRADARAGGCQAVLRGGEAELAVCAARATRTAVEVAWRGVGKGVQP
eukprot:TRINITY_DN6325_c0_g1_i4.p1 TRINITY_DN6325_c0_g1~~TRINITY_DN6325_c0_g1_i4.p1  ORF type:complete len:406 (+),score=48.55 TRINITY_DN6325_c0_g1_i4:55-1272(+)